MDGNEDGAKAVYGRPIGEGGTAVVRRDLTLAELATRHRIHPRMIETWKRHAVEGMATTFSSATHAVRAAGDTEIEKVHAKIGQLLVEREFVGGVPAMSVLRRRQMIEREHADLLIPAQYRLASISRSSFYAPVSEMADMLALMTVIDASFLDHP